MPVSSAYRPEPRFFDLGDEYGDAVRAAEFPQAILRFRNDRAAAQVGLKTLTDQEWVAHFGRFEALPGQPGPVAMRYHGHQFRTYNPDLGDGRGFLFAQLRDASGRLLDLGTKGSGQTPWSRSGDGRLTLKGGVREVLAAEMLEALGVPTSRAFSLIETGEALERGDEPSPTRSAVLVRLSHSHVRFGTFQRAAYFDRMDMIGDLIRHVLELYYPEIPRTGDPAIDGPVMLEAVARASARLVARWTAAGFVHGVLNTDNLNMTGESFDYGPWRFLPAYEPGFTAAYFDRTGLYAYARQPEAVFWNLQQVAACLRLVAESEPLIDALNTYGPAYGAELAGAFRRRLGVADAGEAAGTALVEATLALLKAHKAALRFEPVFFDWFGGEASSARALEGPRAAAYRSPEGDAFQAALLALAPDRPERLSHPYFAGSEPQEMQIDEVEAIWAAVGRDDDWTPFHDKIVATRAAGAAYGL